MKERKKETKPRLPGGGRKKESPDINIIVNELIYPSIIEALKTEPTTFKKHLMIELSKSDIRSAYGALGLATWTKYFKQEKIGGINRHHDGYKTLWSLHLSVYPLAVAMVCKQDLPNLEYPPAAMQNRLAEMRSKALINKSKRLDAKNALFLSTLTEAI